LRVRGGRGLTRPRANGQQCNYIDLKRLEDSKHLDIDQTLRPPFSKAQMSRFIYDGIVLRFGKLSNGGGIVVHSTKALLYPPNWIHSGFNPLKLRFKYPQCLFPFPSVFFCFEFPKNLNLSKSPVLCKNAL
jgi:hypothetical protein